jgi:hypothetical protein
MKIVRPFICLAFFVFTLAAYAGEDFKFPIYQRVSGYGVTNTWFVPMSRLEKLPKWNEQGEPPLSVGKAMSLAKAWIVSKGFNTNCWVSSIEFRSVDRGAPPVPPNKLSVPSKLRPCWFYIIHFEEVAMVGSWATCVVLSDGSIVEPECSPKVPDSKSDLRYLD